MTELARLALCLRLKDAQGRIGDLFESLASQSNASSMLSDAHALADLAGEIESALKSLATSDVLAFTGGNVVLGELPMRDAASDKQAQRDMAAMHLSTTNECAERAL